MKTGDRSVKGYLLKEIRNETEVKVCILMEKILDRPAYSKMCSCGICIEDIYGLALNKLPPQYRHSHSINLKIGKNHDKKIESAIIAAIKKVGKNKKHL